jgi:cellulose synthase/poly-beta-1,6-N-acetylglucosamine synthase-like glycosyltransferase
MFQLIFFISLSLLVYAYWLYPLMLLVSDYFIADKRKLPPTQSEGQGWPSVSLLLAAHNEEKVISAKILNYLNCQYPGSTEMVIVSDGSTDRTVELARSIREPRVRVIARSKRAGKGVALNHAIEEAHGEIIAFTDANAFFAADSIVELVRPFFDPRVGLVTGCTRYTEGTIGSLYQRYELALKRLEARRGVVATADGAIYAMRRSLLRQHDPSLVNDFLHPILVNLQGYDAVIATKAVCGEEFSVNNEFARQVRMVSLASLVYLTMLPELVRMHRWRPVIVLSSHKLLRWLTAPLLVLTSGASLCLTPLGGIYQVAIVGEIAFVVFCAAGALARKLSLNERLTVVYQFVVLNWAGALGLWRCLTGTVPVMWQPRGE